MRSLILLACLCLAGCTSVFELPDGRYVVPRQAEVRSLFGTNTSWTMLEACKDKIVDEYKFGVEYKNCTQLTQWQPLASPGAGGLIIQGALIGGGLAGAGALTGTVATSSSAIVNTVAPRK